MGLGILEPKVHRDQITGTIIMLRHEEEDTEDAVSQQETEKNDDADDIDSNSEAKFGSYGPGNARRNSTASAATLKTTKDGIILNPQPHDNPNDPLNAPIWRRDLALLVIGFHSFVGGGQTPILAAGLSSIESEFDVSSSTGSYLVGAFMLALGFGSLFASPTALLYGKRVVYLVGIIIAIGGAIWAACAKSFGSLMGSRVLMGIGFSPTESLPSATIAEIYFAHERAYRLGIYTFLLLGGKNLVPMLSAFVFQNLSRHWLFWILTIFLGFNLTATFLFVPETFWDRTPIPDKRSQEETRAAKEYEEAHLKESGEEHPRHRPNSFAIINENGSNRDLDHDHSFSRINDVSAINETVSVIPSLESSLANNDDIAPKQYVLPNNAEKIEENNLATDFSQPIKRKSYAETLNILSGRHTVDKWWMVFLRPFVLYLYPSVLFGALVYSFAIVWLILISETISKLFSESPYDYSQIIIGLFYVSPFIGCALGSIVAGKFSDFLVRKLVAKNNGTYEPEFRLVMIIPVVISICIGLMGFGWSIQNKDLWIVPVIFFGVLGFGSSLASTTAITYTVDSYRIFATEALVSLNFSKNLLGFIFSLFNTSFVAARGVRTAFLTFGGVQIFICLFAIPLYIHGKRCRAWTDDREFMKWLYVRYKPNNTKK
ncbi:hypothetical protein PACTADRAFT_51380 [Pachysolen tannophilus NRRL Y-2460]|uniref:Major facilitator superfamily (MFS) profile domain-containing protein n=1 Tax=Pachysolen tannophilus NRRL Y-2460 TaxID=669874 RepID=A0A1E4TPD1_PACTA|nr:hypothetical protein PACTADRAFT_51380 [Pachysolen tannophilus NRRL Y-2460]